MNLRVRAVFTLDGKKVSGPGAKSGIVFGENGEIIGASKIWREIEPYRETDIITPEEAFQEFKERWPREGKPEELEKADIHTRVHVKTIELTYYAKSGREPQKYLKPVYIFKGDYVTTGRVGEQEIGEKDIFEIILNFLSQNYQSFLITINRSNYFINPLYQFHF